jgi:hypothetical protein
MDGSALHFPNGLILIPLFDTPDSPGVDLQIEFN